MNIKLNYIEKGSGFPLILLHGNGENSEYFSAQIDYFSEHCRVIAPDTRGHGRSPRGDGEFSIRRFADDLFEFMAVHNIEKANIIGFSDGGNIALCFAIKHPEMIEKLVVCGANLFCSGVKASVQIPIVIGYKIANLFKSVSEKARKNAEILGVMVNDPNILPEELSPLNMPVLVVAGTDDMIRKEHTLLIGKSIPTAKTVFIPGDHFIVYNKHEEFNQTVFKFLFDKQ